MIGSAAGARLAVRNGDRLVRAMVLVVVLAVVVKLAVDLAGVKHPAKPAVARSTARAFDTDVNLACVVNERRRLAIGGRPAATVSDCRTSKAAAGCSG